MRNLGRGKSDLRNPALSLSLDPLAVSHHQSETMQIKEGFLPPFIQGPKEKENDPITFAVHPDHLHHM